MKERYMSKVWEIWKDGGWVFLRWLWFSFILTLISMPIRYAIVRIDFPPLPRYAYIPIFILAYIIVAPFIMFLVSEWTGEFVTPRISRKKIKNIEQSVAGYGPQAAAMHTISLAARLPSTARGPSPEP